MFKCNFFCIFSALLAFFQHFREQKAPIWRIFVLLREIPEPSTSAYCISILICNARHFALVFHGFTSVSDGILCGARPRKLSYLFQNVLGVDAQEADGGELATHVLERVAAVIDAVVHNQPAVM